MTKYITVKLTEDQVRMIATHLDTRILQAQEVLTKGYTEQFLEGRHNVKEVHAEREAEIAFIKRTLTALAEAKS